MNGNGNGNGWKRIGGTAGIVVALGSAGTWLFTKFDDINRTLASRNERITVLEYKIEAAEKVVNAKTEDRFTGKDGAELRRRIENLEKKVK